MNIYTACLCLAAGLVILWKCAELMVAGAVGLAERLGVSPLIIGLTIVAMGTSAPEVAASIAAVLKESGGDIAIGNVFGSNIANLALVGGLVAIIRPLKVNARVLRCEAPVMLGVGLLLWPFLRGGHFSRGEAVGLLAIFTGLMSLLIYTAKKHPADKAESFMEFGDELQKAEKLASKPFKITIVYIIIGLLGLALGAEMAVYGATFIGETVGLSEAVIGLTIIAFGTSLPELVTCVVAAIKGQDDISVGNLVGSNIFNTLLVTGGAGTVKPFSVGPRLAGGIDFWIMIAVAAGFAFLAIAGRRVVGRISGLLLVGAYIAYIVYRAGFNAAL